MFAELGHWIGVKDGNAKAAALFSRHYSAHHYKDRRRSQIGYRNRFLIVGPGQKLVLMTVNCDALFVWRKFIDDSGQTGVNCAVFRNESPALSSLLILEAEQLAWSKWPGHRLYTYVDASKVSSCNPGYCFKKAGWQLVRNSLGEPLTTKSGKLILEKYPV